MSALGPHPIILAFGRKGVDLANVYATLADEPEHRRLGLQVHAWLREGPPALAEIRTSIERIDRCPIPESCRAVLYFAVITAVPMVVLQPVFGDLVHRLHASAAKADAPLVAVLPQITVRHLGGTYLRASIGEPEPRSRHRLQPNPAFYHYIWYLALAGIAEPLLGSVADLHHPDDGGKFPKVVHQARITNHLICGNITAATQLLADYDGGHFVLLDQLTPIAFVSQALLSGIPVTREEVLEHMPPKGTFTGRIRQDTLDFALTPFADARELRAIANRPHREGQLRTTTSFINFNAIRAAILLGDIDLAAELLEYRARNYLNTYLDHLFWMRVHLLDRNRDKAALHYRALIRKAHYHRTQNRVELELRLSRELSLRELAGLAVDEDEVPDAEHATRAPTVRSGLRRLVGLHPSIEAIRQQIDTYAGSEQPLLILGETGTGKDLIAQAIHESGPRSDEPFVTVNCAAVNESLLEAELFGHVRGSYTGATADRSGLIASAGTGTLFLDEIGDTTPRFQSVLLRLLENREYRSIGSDATRRMACRIIAATNRDIADPEQFRSDLFFRLERLLIQVPPLRERREDIAPLARHFLTQAAGEDRHLDRELEAHLAGLDWPGNVRQLRNEMELLHLHRPTTSLLDLADYHDLPRPDSVETRRLRRQPQPEAGERAAPPTPTPSGAGNPQMARAREIAALFERHGRLTRKEVMQATGISQSTATRYLKQLCAAGIIDKIMPTGAPITHYFTLKESAPTPTSLDRRDGG